MRATRRGSHDLVPVFTLVASVLGFVAALVLNAFVLDEYDAYGEVTIPGSTNLHLPAGEVTVNFHTMSPAGRQADFRSRT